MLGNLMVEYLAMNRLLLKHVLYQPLGLKMTVNISPPQQLPLLSQMESDMTISSLTMVIQVAEHDVRI